MDCLHEAIASSQGMKTTRTVQAGAVIRWLAWRFLLRSSVWSFSQHPPEPQGEFRARERATALTEISPVPRAGLRGVVSSELKINLDSVRWS